MAHRTLKTGGPINERRRCMTTDLATLIDRFAGLDVLVVGDTILDSYLEGTAARCCREAPVPRVTLSRRCDVPGPGSAPQDLDATARVVSGAVRPRASTPSRSEPDRPHLGSTCRRTRREQHR